MRYRGLYCRPVARHDAADRRYSRIDERNRAAPRAGRRRHVDRPGGRRCPGPSPAVHRRSVAGRPSADDLGRWPLRHHLQRRGLQPRGNKALADRARHFVSRPFGYRSHSGIIRRVRRRSDAAPADRNVHNRAVGPPRAHAHADARPARHQTALLGQVRRSVPVRLRAQGVACASWLDAAHRSQRRGELHAAQLHHGAAHDL